MCPNMQEPDNETQEAHEPETVEAGQNLEERPLDTTPPSPITLAPLTTYELDKRVGKRDVSGRWQLQELKPKHCRMIAAHMEGVSNIEIAAMFDVTETTISRVLNDPLAQQLIKTLERGLTQELRGLLKLAIAALREAMSQADSDTKLKAIDRFEKLYKLLHPDIYVRKESVSVSIQREETHITVTGARDRFLEELTKVSQKYEPILEGKFEEVVPEDSDDA